MSFENAAESSVVHPLPGVWRSSSAARVTFAEIHAACSASFPQHVPSVLFVYFFSPAE